MYLYICDNSKCVCTRGAHKDAFVVVEAVGQREREARGALLVQIPVERHLPKS